MVLIDLHKNFVALLCLGYPSEKRWITLQEKGPVKIQRVPVTINKHAIPEIQRQATEIFSSKLNTNDQRRLFGILAFLLSGILKNQEIFPSYGVEAFITRIKYPEEANIESIHQLTLIATGLLPELQITTNTAPIGGLQ